MDTISYADSTEDRMFAVPAERHPRFIGYTAAMDNHEPVRQMESGRLVEYDEPAETSGQPRYLRATRTSDIPAGSIIIIDDGYIARPYYGGSHQPGTPSPLYPEGCEPFEILFPFPVNPDGKRRPDNGEVIDFSFWFLGPRKAYLLKITREA